MADAMYIGKSTTFYSIFAAGRESSLFYLCCDLRGIKTYQESNMLEKARARPNTVAMIASIFQVPFMVIGALRRYALCATASGAFSIASWRFKASQRITM